MTKANFHKDVDYSILSEKEKKIKASRELYTIFYLTNNVGLTDMEIYKHALQLGFTGYKGYAPEAIVRNNIYRWNGLAVSAATGGKMCDTDGCKKFACWGFETHNPTKCQRHSEKDMTKVVEERLIRTDKESGSSKGKFFFEADFANKVFPNGTPAVNANITKQLMPHSTDMNDSEGGTTATIATTTLNDKDALDALNNNEDGLWFEDKDPESWFGPQSWDPEQYEDVIGFEDSFEKDTHGNTEKETTIVQEIPQFQTQQHQPQQTHLQEIPQFQTQQHQTQQLQPKLPTTAPRRMAYDDMFGPPIFPHSYLYSHPTSSQMPTMQMPSSQMMPIAPQMTTTCNCYACCSCCSCCCYTCCSTLQQPQQQMLLKNRLISYPQQEFKMLPTADSLLSNTPTSSSIFQQSALGREQPQQQQQQQDRHPLFKDPLFSSGNMSQFEDLFT